MALRPVINNDPLRDADADDLNQLVHLVNGQPAYGQPVSFTQLDSADWALSVRNLNGAGNALLVRKADGTVLLQANAAGVLVSPDGGAAVAPLTAAATQTMSAKTVGDALTFSDQGSDPAAPGAGRTKLYSRGGAFYLRAGAAGAAAVLSAVRLAPDVTFGSAAASVSFVGIPTGYRTLLLGYTLRGDAAAAAVDLLLRCNADGGANYDYTETIFLGGALSGAAGAAQTAMRIGRIPAATAPASAYGVGQARVRDYAGGTAHVAAEGTGLFRQAAGQPQSVLAGGIWLSTAAVSQLTLLPLSGNFAGGTVSLHALL